MSHSTLASHLTLHGKPLRSFELQTMWKQPLLINNTCNNTQNGLPLFYCLWIFSEYAKVTLSTLSSITLSRITLSSILEFCRNFKQNSQYSNSLFNFSGCVTSQLLKYLLPCNKTLTHCHTFRHHPTFPGVTSFLNDTLYYQQRFVGLQDLKKSWRRLQDMLWRRL